MMIQDFLQRHRIFSLAEFTAVLREEKPRSRDAIDAYLRRLRIKGRIGRIRRELYYSVPPGENPDSCFVDLGLAASRMSSDAIIAYLTALEYHTGTPIPSWNKVFFLSEEKIRPANFEDIQLTPCRVPASLLKKDKQSSFTQTTDWMGFDVCVTNMERSLVDVFDRLRLCGGWKRVAPLLDRLPTIDLEKTIEYLDYLDNPTTTAKVGWYLNSRKRLFDRRSDEFRSFRNRLPAQPRYLIPGQRGGTLVRDWKLIVPKELAGY